MAWAKARSSARSRSRAAASSADSSGRPLLSTASSRRIAARRAAVPGGSAVNPPFAALPGPPGAAARLEDALVSLILPFAPPRPRWAAAPAYANGIGHGRTPAPFEAASLPHPEPARAGAGRAGGERGTWRPQRQGAHPLRRLGK